MLLVHMMMASQALMKAVQSGRFTQTRLLLQMGTEVNAQDTEGQTPLIHALSLRDPKTRSSLLRLLLKAGALVSLSDNQMRNALMWACRLADSVDVRILLRHADLELNVNAQNLEGQTALWIAVDGGKVETVRELLHALSEHELSSEVADHGGITPAMRAAALGHFDCLKVLIAHLDTITKSNNTLINIAKINKILRSMSVVDKPKMTSLSLRTENPDRNNVITPKLPSIRLISTDNYQSVTSTTHSHPQTRKCALFSLEFLRDSTRTSTLISKRVPNIDLRPQHSVQESPIHSDSEEPSSIHHIHGLRRDRAVFLGEKSHAPSKKISAAVKFEDQEQSLHEHKRSVSTPPQTGPLADFPLSGPIAAYPGRIFLKPLASVTVFRGSVRDSIPGLFDMFAEQTSGSFRKAAMKPVPKKKKKQGWSKLRELTLRSGGLGKMKGAGAKGKLRAKPKLTLVKHHD